MTLQCWGESFRPSLISTYLLIIVVVLRWVGPPANSLLLGIYTDGWAFHRDFNFQTLTFISPFHSKLVTRESNQTLSLKISVPGTKCRIVSTKQYEGCDVNTLASSCRYKGLYPPRCHVYRLAILTDIHQLHVSTFFLKGIFLGWQKEQVYSWSAVVPLELVDSGSKWRRRRILLHISTLF